jgi:hypothetical protein
MRAAENDESRGVWIDERERGRVGVFGRVRAGRRVRAAGGVGVGAGRKRGRERCACACARPTSSGGRQAATFLRRDAEKARACALVCRCVAVQWRHARPVVPSASLVRPLEPARARGGVGVAHGARKRATWRQRAGELHLRAPPAQQQADGRWSPPRAPPPAGARGATACRAAAPARTLRGAACACFLRRATQRETRSAVAAAAQRDRPRRS